MKRKYPTTGNARAQAASNYYAFTSCFHTTPITLSIILLFIGLQYKDITSYNIYLEYCIVKND